LTIWEINYSYTTGTGLNLHEYERNIDFTSPKRVASSDFSSYDVFANFNISKSLSYKKLTSSPYFGMDSSYIFREKFSEKRANSLNATFNKNSSVSLVPKIGIYNEYEVFSSTAKNYSLVLNFSTEYSHELGSVKDKEKYGLKGFDGSSTLRNPMREEGELTYGAGISYKFNNFEVGLNYNSGEFSDDKGSLNFKYNW